MNPMYSSSPNTIVEVGIDWITATYGAGERGQVIKGRIAHWQQERQSLGFKPNPFRNPWYTGVQCGGVTYGERDSDRMLTLSGVPARKWAATAITWSDNISRLDVQVTLRDDNLDNDWAGYADGLAALLPDVKAGALETRLIRRRPEGVTSYIGAGASDRMMRCYDKHAESDHQYGPGTWRWEIQYRGGRAYSVARQLLTGDKLVSECLRAVCAAYASYKIDLPCLCLPAGWKDTSPREEPDDERRLAWLRRCIRPMLEKLREAHNTDDLLDTLGFDDVIDTLEGLTMQANAAADLYAAVEKEKLSPTDPGDLSRMN